VFEIAGRQFLQNLDSLEENLKPLLDFGSRQWLCIDSLSCSAIYQLSLDRRVAECIEDADTARISRDMGVNLGHGWHFGYPEISEMR